MSDIEAESAPADIETTRPDLETVAGSRLRWLEERRTGWDRYCATQPPVTTIPGRDAPTVGSKIFVPDQISLTDGGSDLAGGLATVAFVRSAKFAGRLVYFVATTEHPLCVYNWALLTPRQDHMRQIFGDQLAHEDPHWED